ncbi:MAG: hypothetical protein ACOZFS_04405 [Thermodesulfobacteriota bacterium]
MAKDYAEEIEEVRKTEDKNYLESRKLLGETVSLIHDLINLYDLIGEIIEDSKIKAKKESVAAFKFMLACRYYLMIGTLACLRGHLTDSFSFTRNAIEVSGYAFKVKKHPHLTKILIDAANHNESYLIFNQKYKIGKTFAIKNDILQRLYKCYEYCFKSIHPSIYSFDKRVTFHRIEESIIINISFDNFELKNNYPSDLIRTFLWIIHTHFTIIELFEEIFKNVIKTSEIKWDFNSNSVKEKIQFHKTKWKGFWEEP